MPEIPSQELSDIKEQLAIIRTTGENTLAECRKTNGRVTKLEDSHNSLKIDLAVLKTSVEKDIKTLDKDLGEITPQVAENNSFMHFLRGNWQGVLTIAVIVGYIIDKLWK